MIEIRHRYTNAVLCSYEVETVKEAVEKANLDGANLIRANLDGANLVRANLYGANLDGANLIRANLYGANLDGANLIRANLDGANLYGANLDGANLYGANLDGANLIMANLDGANLIRANLYGANLDGEILAIAPISIGNLNWFVLISEGYMKIGCQRHTHEEWKAFNANSIAKMHSDAAAFWKQWKSPLLAMCKAHRAESLAYRKANPEKFAEAA